MSAKTGRIPYELIPGMLILALSQQGKTMKQIERQRGREYAGDKTQMGHKNRQVWHTKANLDEFVATKLKLHPSFWGSDKTTSDFLTATTREIIKMRKKGIILDWNSSRRFCILRLVETPIPSLTDLSMSLVGSIPVQTTTPAITEADPERAMREKFFSIVAMSKKDNTYKFALARAILDHCGVENAGNVITYEYLSKKFLRYYWHQECIFKIKQDFHAEEKRKPRVIKAIQDVFGNKSPGRFELLDPDCVKKAEGMILRNVFGKPASRLFLVIPAFQKIPVGRRVEENRIFYDYDNDKKMIILKPGVFEFFHKNRNILMGLVIAEWAKFLEKINGSLPMLVAKIEKNNTKRDPNAMSKFRKLFQDTDHCFYCGNKLEQRYVDVDHFIPWSYIFADSMWNLVLACRDCNCYKSNSLPQDEFLVNLIKRNKQYYNVVDKLKISLDQLDIGKGWMQEICNHYNMCEKYGFSVKNMP